MISGDSRSFDPAIHRWAAFARIFNIYMVLCLRFEVVQSRNRTPEFLSLFRYEEASCGPERIGPGA